MNSGIYTTWFQSGLKPSEVLTVSQWSDKYRILSKKASSESGIYRTSRTPYMKEIMDCLSDTSPIQSIVFMKGSQIGATEIGNNWIGYTIDHAPAPFLAVQPTLDLAKRNSKQRIGPLIEECPRLARKVLPKKSRDSSNTILLKEFPGGLLVLTGANSASGLKSLPCKKLFLDEVDEYPVDLEDQGDPISLARKRTTTFSKRKEYMCSTPTMEDASRIATEFKETDQRYYFVPCPRCNEFQVLVWEQVKWKDGDHLKAWYVCVHCDGKIQNWEKTKMLPSGKWKPTAPDKSQGKTRGYHLNELYSPVGWMSWGELAADYIKAKKRQDEGSNEEIKTFTNTALGLTYKEIGESPDWKRLYEKREMYTINTIPSGVIFLTCGVDIQKDRIELEVVGWGRGKISHSIDYRVIRGDTSTLTNECWDELDKVVGEVWENEAGFEVPLKLMAVDSGYNTSTVYSWVRRHPNTKVVAIKGSDNMNTAVGLPKDVDIKKGKKRIRRALKLIMVGSNLIKEEIYGFLKLESPDEGKPEPQGYCHFPQYGEDYFKMLTAEERQKKVVRGFPKYEWVKIRNNNESLDCRVYARAAATMVGIDRFKDAHWSKLEETMGISNITKGKEPEPFKKKKKTVTIKRRPSTFL